MKFDGNTATLLHLYIICGCLGATTAELTSVVDICHNCYTLWCTKPKIFTLWIVTVEVCKS